MTDDPRKPQPVPLQKEGGDRASPETPKSDPPGPGGMAGEADPARGGERRGGMEGEG
jgi:hypothetical protein